MYIIKKEKEEYKKYYYTSIYSLIFSNNEVPIPDTFFISSIELKGPFSSLYLIIESALLSPIPLILSNSSFVAVLIEILEELDELSLLEEVVLVPLFISASLKSSMLTIFSSSF
jgi:hypothetical protein